MFLLAAVPEILDQCVNVFGFRKPAGFMGIEIAVGTFSRAPGKVHVETKRDVVHGSTMPSSEARGPDG